jgi:hypothetical protein
MDVNQVWKSKEAKSYLLKILGRNPDGTILVTFDFRLNPRRVYSYPLWYLEQYYEYAGYESVWSLDAKLAPIPAPKPPDASSPESSSSGPVTSPVTPTTEPPESAAAVAEQAVAALDLEKVLFTNHAGGRKENVWKEIPA